MAEALSWIGGGLAAFGAVLVMFGAVGVLRFPDVYTRIHAASITDTGGASLVFIGLCLIAGVSMETLKLLVAWAFIMLTSPVAAHALGNAAFSSGHAPWIGAFRIMRDDQAGDSSSR